MGLMTYVLPLWLRNQGRMRLAGVQMVDLSQENQDLLDFGGR
ncbi:hypothetical protein [Oculatella sp. LEGE 06141]|nr:hypothetical protein [Oculatella sp. LEGE 06141]